MSPEMSQEVEMSPYEQKAAQIFKLILEDGEPKTSYDLIFKKNQPTATVHRHLKRMIDDGEITVYEDSKNTRGKKPYGPTLYGLISYYGVDKDYTKNLERYFELWKNNQLFREALKQMGFDKKKMEKFPDECKRIFKVWIGYGAMCEEAYDKLAEDPYEVPYEGQQFIGGLLLANNEKANKFYQELYAFSEPFRKIIDNTMEQMINGYNEMKKKSKELKKKWE